MRAISPVVMKIPVPSTDPIVNNPASHAPSWRTSFGCCSSFFCASSSIGYESITEKMSSAGCPCFIAVESTDAKKQGRPQGSPRLRMHGQQVFLKNPEQHSQSQINAKDVKD